jgi:hypothetical protein
MPLPPRAALMQFLGRVFTADELAPWVFLHLHDLKDKLPPHVPIDALAMAVVDLAGNRDLIDAPFFDALRQTFPRHTAEISGLADLWQAAAPATHTARVIDRISQWSSLLDACSEQNDHLVFLVHGGPDGSVQQFMQRIGRYLDHECARRHTVAHVDTGSDQQMVNTAQSWERAFIKKTNLEGGDLDVALADFAEPRAVLFLLEHRQGPLPLERFATRPQAGRREPLKELGSFLSSPNMCHALKPGRLAHPIRIVIPIEYARGADLNPVAALREVLARASPLVHDRKLDLVLAFPEWPDVEPSLRDKLKGVDEEMLAACKRAHEAIADRPDRSVRLLGNEIHNLILDWKHDHHV